jgi:20S proteasome subunit beta 7
MLDRVNVPMKLKHGLIYDHPMNTSLIRNSTVTHTQTPIVTGTSVLGVRYRDGIMLAADTLASYGSLARFFDVQRLYPVGSYTIVGASGDLSDFQYLQSLLDELMIDDYITQDQHSYSPEHIYQYLGRVMYQRRSKFDPLWNALVVGGYRDGRRFLGYVDLKGTMYEAPSVATGFGAYLAQPLLRKAVENGGEATLTAEAAKDLLETCMRTLYYRDARSMNKFQIARLDAEGIFISEPYHVTTEWDFAEKITGYA